MGREKKRAKGEQELKAEKEAAARKRIEQVELQLKEAEDEVNRAQSEIKRLEENPLVPEPTMEEEIIEAEKAIAAIDAHNKGESRTVFLLRNVGLPLVLTRGAQRRSGWEAEAAEKRYDWREPKGKRGAGPQARRVQGRAAG